MFRTTIIRVFNEPAYKIINSYVFTYLTFNDFFALLFIYVEGEYMKRICVCLFIVLLCSGCLEENRQKQQPVEDETAAEQPPEKEPDPVMQEAIDSYKGIEDPVLRKRVLEELGLEKYAADKTRPTAEDMEKLVVFRADNRWNITSLKGLEVAFNLKMLSLDGTGISDLQPISQLPSLEKLYLSGNEIKDISHLSGLTSLQALTLCGNDIVDFSPLKELEGLRILGLGASGLNDISFLSHLKALETLNLRENHIADISPLSKLTALSKLDLSHNKIETVDALANHKSLTTLILSNNAIREIDPLANITSLLHLDLSNNPIDDFSPVEDLELLELIR
ncbi:MAG TPA: leucine-rich repeat domain-containing protein [Bacillus bacterium]|nr:leucine-rich repeat domain-containing protein [Bacillus sp. (in: firmicutes)]